MNEKYKDDLAEIYLNIYKHRNNLDKGEITYKPDFIKNF